MKYRRVEIIVSDHDDDGNELHKYGTVFVYHPKSDSQAFIPLDEHDIVMNYRKIKQVLDLEAAVTE